METTKEIPYNRIITIYTKGVKLIVKTTEGEYESLNDSIDFEKDAIKGKFIKAVSQ